MVTLPDDDPALVVRTDFRDEVAWSAVREAIISNMDFADFAESVEGDGVFRGF